MELAPPRQRLAKPWLSDETKAAQHLLTQRQRENTSDAATDRRTTGYVRELCSRSLLSADEERILFAYFARLRGYAEQLQVIADDLQCRESARDLAELEQQIVEVRNHLVESNLRLVVSIARSFRNPHDVEFYDLISEGTSVLMKSVDLFNTDLGYRFSTYATTALKRGLYNFCNRDHRRKTKFLNGSTEFDHLEEEPDSTAELSAAQEVVRLLDVLDERERQIVIGRFGLNSSDRGLTFRQLGEEFKLSKERIRQIVGGAISKMKSQIHKQPAFAELM